MGPLAGEFVGEIVYDGFALQMKGFNPELGLFLGPSAAKSSRTGFPF